MVIVLLEYIDLFLRLAVLQVRIFSILKIIIPIMLALCLMLSGTYYAKNYAGIIGRGLSYIIVATFTDYSIDHNITLLIAQCMHYCDHICKLILILATFHMHASS